MTRYDSGEGYNPRGMIFNIEKFATEDGPGIRTVVFMKGCLLRCKWCANPESQSFGKQILVNNNLCRSCGKCSEICPKNNIKYLDGYGYISLEEVCGDCQICVDQCFYDARSIAGEKYTVDEVYEEIIKDINYYQESNGGVTFSGGEPLLQDRFLECLIKRLKEQKIHVLIETCGHVDLEKIKRIAPIVDEIFFDIKSLDPVKHKTYTGYDNSRILENLKWLDQNFAGNISLRYPYIPGHNDDPQEIEKFIKFANGMKKLEAIWFLPYHRLGLPKYEGLGRQYEMGDLASLKLTDLNFLQKYQDLSKYTIKIG